MENRAYENLSNAVVEQAATDYRYALIRLKKCQDEVEELERFFTGDGIKMWTDVDGNMLMERLREQVVRCHYSMVAIRKEIGGKEVEET